jgi:hypothetical protein
MLIRRVGLAALTGGKHPGPGLSFRQLGWNIDHLVIRGQAQRDVPAAAAAALDRPDRSGHRRR